MNFSNVKTFVMEQGHGVKGLSELQLTTLPNEYIQPQEERHDKRSVITEESIPLIDMSEFDSPMVADLICNAAEKWGFFQIVNFGVPSKTINDVKNAAYQFFSLPAEEKNKYSKDFSPSSNVIYGTSFSPKLEKALEWKDRLSCFYVSNEDANTHWPSVCRNELLEYMDKCDSVIKKLIEILVKRMNIEVVDKSKQSMLMGSKTINLNYYPICPNPELTIGLGRHSDASTLTILLQDDDVGGLYVRKMEYDKWIPVPPIKGSITINIGDALEIMSNGLYKSVEHRVSANGSKSRVSVPLFVHPRPKDIIGPFPEVLQQGHKAIYKNVLYSDYINHYFSKGHDGKATINFAKI